ncbi:MAG: 50S ribosomal protein L23 [Chloroflexi bacterium]|nr:50S ribosomal protein L23 [Chloroflexota bacterium]MCL5109936.1 50S ribosomal protein L23 [Chloroflexota bacterium]
MAGLGVYDILRRPIITEKGTAQLAQSKYTFEVDVRANKHQIADAVETVFKVNVTDVNVSTARGKKRRVGRHYGTTPDWKKAVVTLKEGQRIDVFEGV